MHIIRNSVAIEKPSSGDVVYYREQLDRIRRVAILRRELGEPDRLLEAGVAILERRVAEMEGGE